MAYINIVGVSLKFHLYFSKQINIKETIINKILGREYFNYKELWALKDINLSIKDGDRLGIIGQNGAGKSTLLKCIARIYKPAKGYIQTSGFLVPLIEVGIGFNHELSGLENIFLCGAVMGFNREQMEKKVDSILEFAELQDFKETPVKYYSSGMVSRLAFTIATEIDPEILLLDEIFTTGDIGFFQKAEKRMKALIEKCKIVIVVSHSMDIIQKLCNKAILIDHGRMISQGPVNPVISDYYRLLNLPQEPKKEEKQTAPSL